MSRLKAKAPDLKSPGKAKGLLFGATGVGKTWFALSFPAPMYFDTEGGARLGHYQQRLKEAGGGYMGPKDGTLEFDTLIEQIDALASEKHGYKTLVVDSITKICATRIAKDEAQLGSKAAWGNQKKPMLACMRQLMARLDRLDMNVWFIAHETPKWMSVGGQRQEVGIRPDIDEKTKLEYDLDLTLHVEKHNPGLRTATVYKTRLQGFPDGERFDLLRGKDDVGYAEFSKRYGKDFIEGDVKPIVLATPEQVAEINSLLEIVKIPEEDLEKAMTKYGVDKWSELTSEQADVVLKGIRAKLPKEVSRG